MNDNLKRALAEVDIILNNSKKEIIDKIPKKFIEYIKENKDGNHKIKLDANKELENQDIMLETKAILAIIYRDYLCSQEERKRLLKEEQEERNLVNEERKEKYKIDFNKEKIQKDAIKTIENTNLLVQVPKEKWYQKLIKNILNFFKINGY